MLATSETLTRQNHLGRAAARNKDDTHATLMRFGISCAKSRDDAALARAWLDGFEAEKQVMALEARPVRLSAWASEEECLALCGIAR